MKRGLFCGLSVTAVLVAVLIIGAESQPARKKRHNGPQPLLDSLPPIVVGDAPIFNTTSIGISGTGVNGSIGINGTGVNGTIGTGINGTGVNGSIGINGTGFNGTIGTGINGTFGTGINGTFGTGINGTFGTGINGTFGTGINGTFGTGINGTFGTGINSTFGTGINGTLGTGINGTFGTGIDRMIRTNGTWTNGTVGTNGTEYYDDYYDEYEYDDGYNATNTTMGTSWNSTETNGTLLVRWGADPSKRGVENFIPLPLTETEAIVQQWTLDSDACAALSPTYWRGRRYRMNGDPAVSLIYDYQGSLAGLQTAFIPTDPVAYPDSLVYRNIFNTEGGQRVGTVYFKHPLSICNPVNMSEHEGMENLGNEIGDQLFIQTGPDPINEYAHIHKSEMELLTKSMWKPGSCVDGVGRHYWFNVSSETPCPSFVPISLLYNDRNELSGFSWVFRADNNQAGYGSPRYERLPVTVSSTFFQQNMPICLTDKPLVMLHFFFKPNAWETLC